MLFKKFIERMYGSKTKVRVLLFLLSSDDPVSERELAKYLDISHTAVNKIMKDFHDIHLITPLRIGKSLIWRLNKESYAYKVLNLEYLAKHGPLKELKERILVHLNSCEYIKKAVIFGSISRGDEIPSSDIDLFILIGENAHRKNINEKLSKLSDECLGSFGNVLSPLILTEKELYLKKNKNLVDKIGDGIVVIG